MSAVLTSSTDRIIYSRIALADGPCNVREIAEELYKRRERFTMDECIHAVRRFAFLNRRIGANNYFAVNYTRTGSVEVVSLRK